MAVIQVKYPKTEAVVFDLPAATTAATIQLGSNSVAVRPQFKYVGSIVPADGGQDNAVLSRAGLQTPQSNYVLLQEGGAGLQLQPQVLLQVPGAASAHVRCSGVTGPDRGTGGKTGDLPQWMPEADDGPLSTATQTAPSPLSC